jgi:hypothetical protein
MSSGQPEMMSDQDNGPPPAEISPHEDAVGGGGTAGCSRTGSGFAARTDHSLDVTTASGFFASRTGRT